MPDATRWRKEIGNDDSLVAPDVKQRADLHLCYLARTEERIALDRNGCTCKQLLGRLDRRPGSNGQSAAHGALQGFHDTDVPGKDDVAHW